MAEGLSRRSILIIECGCAAALALAVVPPSAITRAEVPPGQFMAPAKQARDAAERKSAGCITCHTDTDAKTMHTSKAVVLGCTDCHGGDASVNGSGAPGSGPYKEAQRRAHVPTQFRRSSNPEVAYADWLKEDLAAVRFVNPADLRAAPFACGNCHNSDEDPIVHHVSRSLMTTSALLYEAALYNNGVLPGKDAIVGESYGA